MVRIGPPSSAAHRAWGVVSRRLDYRLPVAGLPRPWTSWAVPSFQLAWCRRQTALSSTGAREALLIGSPLVSCRVLRSTVQHKTGPGQFPARQPGCSGGGIAAKNPIRCLWSETQDRLFDRSSGDPQPTSSIGSRESRVLSSSRTRTRGGLLLASMAVELPTRAAS